MRSPPLIEEGGRKDRKEEMSIAVKRIEKGFLADRDTKTLSFAFHP